MAGFTAYCAWNYLPRVYTATATLRLAANEAAPLLETADRPNAIPFDLYKRTQQELLRSRFVVTRALRSDLRCTACRCLKDVPHPAEWLEKNLGVTFPNDSEVMNVSLSATKPEGLHHLVNGVVTAYFEEFAFAERKLHLERLDNLELAYRKAESELRSKRTELKQLVERVGAGESTGLTPMQQNSLRQLAAFQQKSTQLEFDLIQAQSELELYEGADTQGGDVAIYKNLKRKIGLLSSQRRQLQPKLHELEMEARQLGRSSIDVEMMQMEIASLQDVFSRLGAQLARARVELQPESNGSWTRVTLLISAESARPSDAKSRLAKTAAAGIVSLLIAFFFVGGLGSKEAAEISSP